MIAAGALGTTPKAVWAADTQVCSWLQDYTVGQDCIPIATAFILGAPAVQSLADAATAAEELWVGALLLSLVGFVVEKQDGMESAAASYDKVAAMCDDVRALMGAADQANGGMVVVPSEDDLDVFNFKSEC